MDELRPPILPESQPSPSITDLPAPHLYLADQIAQSSRKRRVGVEEFMPQLKSGVTPEQIANAEAAYDATQQQIATQMGQRPTLPEQTTPNMNWGQGLVGLLAAALDPQHAGEITAASLNAPRVAAQQQDQRNMLQYQTALEGRDEMLKFLMARADDETKNLAQLRAQQWDQEKNARGEAVEMAKLQEQSELRGMQQAALERNQKDTQISRARDDMQQAINQQMTTMGSIDETNYKPLADYRSSLITKYGLAENDLPPIPVGKSIRAKNYEIQWARQKKQDEWKAKEWPLKLQDLQNDIKMFGVNFDIRKLNLKQLQSMAPYFDREALAAVTAHEAQVKHILALTANVGKGRMSDVASTLIKSEIGKLDTIENKLQEKLLEKQDDVRFWSQKEVYDNAGNVVDENVRAQSLNAALRALKTIEEQAKRVSGERESLTKRLMGPGSSEVAPFDPTAPLPPNRGPALWGKIGLPGSVPKTKQKKGEVSLKSGARVSY
jgi:hypothetical protein